jgi:hypothetical protein
MRHDITSNSENSERKNPFHPSLVQKMIQTSRPTGNNADSTSGEEHKITNEALVAAGEVLRLFVQEAYHRASIEAECEYESVVDDTALIYEANTALARYGKGNQTSAITTAPIRADHITKIAAELLMDFS